MEYVRLELNKLPGFFIGKIRKMISPIISAGASSGASGSTWQLLFIQDQKSAGTSGGTFTAGAWRTRDLNTAVVNDITGASLSTNQITLPAGTYEFFASAPGYGVSGHVARLYNVTDGAEVGGPGQNAYTGAVQTNAEIFGKFTIDAQKVFELQHQSTGTTANIGFGVGNSLRSVEVYSRIWIWKVA
jgi:hypothetical protein